jgi:hypothetical protein
VRAKIIVVVVLAIVAGLILFLASRKPSTSTQTTDAAPERDAAPLVEASAAPAPPPPPPVVDAQAEASASKLGRPLRVSALGWEVLAPAIVANGGRAPAGTSAFGGEVHLRVSDSLDEIEKQLARGGGDEAGADVAIVALPSFVASYERLRALEPHVFAVAGWSRGREGLLAQKENALTRARAGEESKVAVRGGDPSTALALFAMTEAGLKPRIVPEAKGAQLLATSRPFPTEAVEDTPARLVLSTADASRLIPLVFVAPRGLVEGQKDTMTALVRAVTPRGWSACARTCRRPRVRSPPSKARPSRPRSSSGSG